MRRTHDPQPELGEVCIENIGLDLRSWDDIPALPVGLRHLYSDEGFRDRPFALMDGHMLPGVDRTVERPGMEMWRILVLGVVKQGLGCDFDRLHELANQNRTLRRFLGHADVRNEHRYKYRTLADDVSLLKPGLLVGADKLIVESGHAVAGKKPGAPLRGRVDSFVAETGVHHRTDVSLLWDAMRCLIRATGRAATEHDVRGWRQWKHLQTSVRKLFNTVRSTRRASPERVEEYLDRCRDLVLRVEASLPALAAKDATARTIEEIRRYAAHAVRQIDQVDRRLLKGETIPQDEKVFSIFEPHTRWISKGKAGCPVELGVPVCILEDRHGFVLHHEVMWEGGDVDQAVPMVEAAQSGFPDLRAVSFDRGFHSPANLEFS